MYGRHRHHICEVIVIFLVLIMMVTGKNGYLYKQELLVQQDNMIQLRFYVDSSLIPYPLRDAMTRTNSKVSIFYGPYFNQFTPVHLIQEKPLTFNTITTIIQVNAHQSAIFVHEQLSQIIKAMFAVSISPRYTHSRRLANSTIYTVNDPNDKYCRQHLQQIIRNFLPCRTHAGLAQLIDMDNMYGAGTSGSRRYGLQIQWTSQMFKAIIYVDSSVPIEGINRLRVTDKCLTQSTIQMTDAQGRNIGLKQIVLSRLQQSLTSKDMLNIKPVLIGKQTILGNWYNPVKTLHVHIASTRNLHNNSAITISHILPYRAGLVSLQLDNLQQESAQLSYNYTCYRRSPSGQPRYKQFSIVCDTHITVRCLHETTAKIQFTMRYTMKNRLVCFDQYESIFGGGTEIMNIPIILHEPNTQSIYQINRIYLGPLSLKTSQPDESLPFQVITFVLGIFGYLWLAVWRKLATDIKHARTTIQHHLKQQ